jgi:hypothetical protein
MSRKTGWLARFAHNHVRCRRLLWKFHLIPSGIGPFYENEDRPSGSAQAP